MILWLGGTVFVHARAFYLRGFLLWVGFEGFVALSLFCPGRNINPPATPLALLPADGR
jgi:hypothetical protein